MVSLAQPLDELRTAPVGVFDSGVGGLSVLRVLQQHLPCENWVYFADSAHAPYGEKTTEYVVQRTQHIAAFLKQTQHIKALVVACNTATAEAIHVLRGEYPHLPIVGIEPGIKPALRTSQTRRIGLMATQRTLESQKFQQLLRSMADGAHITVQACPGLALAIEQDAQEKIEALIAYYTSAMGTFGLKNDQIDTLVLGCTHYPLATESLLAAVGPNVTLVDPADGVARQLERLLRQSDLLNPSTTAGKAVGLSSGQGSGLEKAMTRWCAPAHCLPQPTQASSHGTPL